MSGDGRAGGVGGTGGGAAGPGGGFGVPEADAFTRPYWDAAAQGRLLIRHCATCDRVHHYPREFCPYCWSEDVDWRPASGRATLHTWSVVHRNDLPPFGARVPYAAAVVDLAEGPRMMTEVIGCEGTALRIGMELEVAFRAGIPVFRPVAAVPVTAEPAAAGPVAPGADG
ncbi:Zn-ribbon domain-containing OB-fold protein [Streptomyces sp. NPDC127038]|uniref:Zn-ribbon domain-containing OB-fold protein n=1 Tax=Streptomyces sp. NPDC127038 TaxID=3347114 RepID=UPI003653D5E8